MLPAAAAALLARPGDFITVGGAGEIVPASAFGSNCDLAGDDDGGAFLDVTAAIPPLARTLGNLYTNKVMPFCPFIHSKEFKGLR